MGMNPRDVISRIENRFASRAPRADRDRVVVGDADGNLYPDTSDPHVVWVRRGGASGIAVKALNIRYPGLRVGDVALAGYDNDFNPGVYQVLEPALSYVANPGSVTGYSHFVSGWWSNAGWDGDAVANGSYDILLHVWNTNIPPKVRAVNMRVVGLWTTANNGNYIRVYTKGVTNQETIMARGVVANLYHDRNGLVMPDSDGYISVVVAGGPTQVYVYVTGYMT